jgi:hypothetical protein
VISYIVATHDRAVLDANLAASLTLGDGDELVVVEDAPSIAVAYNEGQARAVNRVRCYVHHDVQILDPARLRAELLAHCLPMVGMVGVVGSHDGVTPWWKGRRLGSVVDTRFGPMDFGPGGPCSYLDGLLLATWHTVTWDESYPGWHLYDHDMCQQQIAAGRPNWCLTDGRDLVQHNTAGPSRMDHVTGWDAGLAHFKTKWG